MSMITWKRIVGKIRHELLRQRVENADFCYGLSPVPNKEEVVVSLTSYPARFSELELCLKSLFLQSYKPDRIILWLGSDSLGCDISQIEKFEKYGLEIRIDKDKNIKSHKKYYYALEEFSNALVITVDDDLIYPKDLVSSLIECHKLHPNCIVARRVHRIKWKNENEAMMYADWESECESILEESMELLPTTGAGTLYPPGSVSDEYKNLEVMMEYAFSADDIWMKFMSVKNNTKIVWAPNKMQMPTTINLNQVDNLESINCGQNVNDQVFRALLDYYKLDRRSFQ